MKIKNHSLVLKLFLPFALALFAAMPSYAQLVGDTTGPGDSCATYPQGATSMVADSDNNYSAVTLVCNGSTWQASLASGPFEYSSSGTAYAIVGSDIPAAVGQLDGSGSNYPSNPIHLIGYTSAGRAILGIMDSSSSATMGMFHTGGDNVFWGSTYDVNDPLSGTGIKVNDEDFDYFYFGNVFMRFSDGWQVQLGSESNTADFANDLAFKRRRTGNNPVQTGDLLGSVSWVGEYSTASNLFGQMGADAQIKAVVESGTIDTTVPAKLVFSTTGSGALTEQMVLDGDGNLGIGDATPDVKLDVVGDINYTGVIQDVSDLRLKENVEPLNDSLEAILSLNGYSFTMKDDTSGATEFGLMAQEVETVYPQLVSTQEDGYKTLNYIGLIAPLVEAIKTQQDTIENQRKRIEALEERLTKN